MTRTDAPLRRGDARNKNVNEFPQDAFTKIDAEEDEIFYEPPRLVCHIDDGAIAALTEFYRTILPAGAVLLDLMSSRVSHLPPEIDYAEVVGHGMNAAERLDCRPMPTARMRDHDLPQPCRSVAEKEPNQYLGDGPSISTRSCSPARQCAI